MTPRSTTKKWRALIRRVRKRFPTASVVHVCRRLLKTYDGHLTFDGESYLITISTRIDWEAQVESLLHEWAHVLTIESAWTHTDEWGITYAKIYRAYDSNFQAEKESIE